MNQKTHYTRFRILNRKSVVCTETIVKPLDYGGAISTRDSLAKSLYSTLFDWLVMKINIAVGQDSKHISSIGVLDIYGFESFKVNDFE